MKEMNHLHMFFELRAVLNRIIVRLCLNFPSGRSIQL
jgi:hypothetical protein